MSAIPQLNDEESRPLLAEECEIDSAPQAPRILAIAPRTDRWQAPVSWRELLSIVGLIGLADLTVYRGHGFAGGAAFFALAPLLLLCGAPRPQWRWPVGLTGGMLAVLAAHLVWCGSGGLVALGLLLIAAFAMSAAGMPPFVLEVFVYAFQSTPAGLVGLVHYFRSANRFSPEGPTKRWLTFSLPVAAVTVFSALFILANPDITRFVSKSFRRAWTLIWEPIGVGEFLLWLLVAIVSGGLLRPMWGNAAHEHAPLHVAGDPERQAEAELFAPFRNMLLAVIVLFAAYLVFEFQTLWFRVFPPGFYYAGYAHQGAAWLTVALALATLLLSLIFRGTVLHDPRLSRLRRLAWIWSAENMILAAAVYNRLYIYIGFNGMTRMRTLAIFGISAVVVGFGLVIWKITHRRDFVWLIRRQLCTLAIAVYLLAVTPVDYLVHSYNVRRILAGDLAPSVQISVHPIDSGGALVLSPLMLSSDRLIAEGVRAMLAERALDLEAREARRETLGWTTYQMADRLLLSKLRAQHSEWELYREPNQRNAAFQRFRDYAYQWY